MLLVDLSSPNTYFTKSNYLMFLYMLSVGTPPDLFCSTQPGLLGCKEIVHASFKCDVDVIRKNCKKILKLCESKGYGSVAFPAVNTGLFSISMCDSLNAILVYKKGEFSFKNLCKIGMYHI